MFSDADLVDKTLMQFALRHSGFSVASIRLEKRYSYNTFYKISFAQHFLMKFKTLVKPSCQLIPLKILYSDKTNMNSFCSACDDLPLPTNFYATGCHNEFRNW